MQRIGNPNLPGGAVAHPGSRSESRAWYKEEALLGATVTYRVDYGEEIDAKACRPSSNDRLWPVPAGRGSNSLID